jgi:hypothetical protein
MRNFGYNVVVIGGDFSSSLTPIVYPTICMHKRPHNFSELRGLCASGGER